MHGGKPVARAFLSSCPVGAEEDAGKGLISIRHQLEEIERVVAAKQKHVAHPEAADDFRFRLGHVDALDAEINAVARDLDVPVGVETSGGAGRELAPIRPERLSGRRHDVREEHCKEDGRGKGRSKPHEFYPTRLIMPSPLTRSRLCLSTPPLSNLRRISGAPGSRCCRNVAAALAKLSLEELPHAPFVRNDPRRGTHHRSRLCPRSDVRTAFALAPARRFRAAAAGELGRGGHSCAPVVGRRAYAMGEAHHPLTAARSEEWRDKRTAFFVHWIVARGQPRVFVAFHKTSRGSAA